MISKWLLIFDFNVDFGYREVKVIIREKVKVVNFEKENYTVVLL